MDPFRIEIAFWDSGAVVCALSHHLGGLTPLEFIDYWRNRDKYPVDLERDGFLMSPELYQDDGFVLRVVMGGDLTAAEAEEWVSRSRGRLHLPTGTLILGSAFDWLGYDETVWIDHHPRVSEAIDGGMYEVITSLRVPPGFYQATIYSYIPGDLSYVWGNELGEDFSRDDVYRDYFQRTRPGETLPDWIDDDYPEKAYINLLLHLVPVTQSAFDAFEVNHSNINFGWEFRRPALCPLGIRATTETFVMQADYVEDEAAEENAEADADE